MPGWPSALPVSARAAPPVAANCLQCPNGAADPRAPLFDNAPSTATVAAAEPLADQASGGDGRWVEARHLRLGDRLVTRDGRSATVTGLTLRTERSPVHNLTVLHLRNYAVGEAGVVVHNCSFPTGYVFVPITVEGQYVNMRQTPRGSSAADRRAWSQFHSRPWPIDPATKKPMVVSHEIPLADGGTRHPTNVTPQARAEHMQRHIDRGDFRRWARPCRK